MKYNYLAVSENAFVQQLAVAYVNHGYWFYVTGIVPLNKNAVLVDKKLIQKYDIEISRWARARRKRQGLANVHYLRHRMFFVLIATKGKHHFFDQEGPVLKDIRKEPIKYAGYSISYRQGVDRRGHPSVRIHPNQYNMLKDYFLEICLMKSAEQIGREFNRLPFEPYAPVRRQLLNIVRAVNRARLKAGFEPVPIEYLRLKRHVLKPFIESNKSSMEEKRNSFFTNSKEEISSKRDVKFTQ